MTDAKSGKVYGITVKHILLHAKHLTVKTADGNQHLKFGTPLHDTFSCNDLDVEIFEIEPTISRLARNEVLDKQGIRRSVKLYTGSVKDLFGQKVRKIFPCYSDTVVHKSSTSQYAFFNDKKTYQTYCGKNTFLVKGVDGPFSREGDSGTPVILCDSHNNDLVLVGLIVGGVKNMNGYDTMCIFLPNAKSNLNSVYGMDLKTQLHDKSAQGSISLGSRFFADRQPSFYNCIDMIEFAMAMASGNFSDCPTDCCSSLLKKEKNWTELTYDIKNFDNCCDGFDSDSPALKAVEFGLKGCRCIFLGLSLNAEQYLKEALKCTAKCPDITLRLFGKNLCYLTRYLVSLNTKESRQRLEELFIKAAKFHDENVSKLGFPKETIVNLFLDISRHYQELYMKLCKRTKGNRKTKKKLEQLRQSADKWAERAVAAAERIHYRKQSKFSGVRLTLAKCELAYCLLGCGHEITAVRIVKVPEESILRAEMLLDEAERNKENLFVVQTEKYLLCRTDLKFRQGKYEIALQTAKECQAVAIQKQLRPYITMTFKRIQVLQAVILQKGLAKEIPQDRKKSHFLSSSPIYSLCTTVAWEVCET